MCPFLLENGVLWDMGQVHWGTCATGRPCATLPEDSEDLLRCIRQCRLYSTSAGVKGQRSSNTIRGLIAIRLGVRMGEEDGGVPAELGVVLPNSSSSQYSVRISGTATGGAVGISSEQGCVCKPGDWFSGPESAVSTLAVSDSGEALSAVFP